MRTFKFNRVPGFEFSCSNGGPFFSPRFGRPSDFPGRSVLFSEGSSFFFCTSPRVFFHNFFSFFLGRFRTFFPFLTFLFFGWFHTALVVWVPFCFPRLFFTETLFPGPLIEARGSGAPFPSCSLRFFFSFRVYPTPKSTT